MSALTRTALFLRTADGEQLAAMHVPPAVEGNIAGATAVVLAPGFSGWSERPQVRDLVYELHRSAPSLGIVGVDLRGHGRSSGRSTLGDREVFDVDAAVRAARDLGYLRIITMGWSMGGTCVLRHAALVGADLHGLAVREPTDAVVTVSAISRWDVRDTAAMRRLHRIIETRLGRVLGRRIFRVRIHPTAHIAPELTPADMAARIKVPLLIVHGEKDHYYGWDHARVLAEAAGPDATLWLVAGLGHAEDAAVRPDVPGFLERLGAALEALAARTPVDAWVDERTAR